MNADMLPEFAQQAGQEFFAGALFDRTVVLGGRPFPERWRDSFSLLEEVWAPTAHIAAALEPMARVPVTTVRIPVQLPPLEPRSRAEMGLPEDKFMFLFSFDYLSVFKRKNPLAVIEAFTRGVRARRGRRARHQVHQPRARSEPTPALRGRGARHADIAGDRPLSVPSREQQSDALCDSYVSLHRAEGFGLVLAEAMWQANR